MAKRVFGHDQLRFERQIVEQFGDGILRADKYLLDHIQNAPPGKQLVAMGANELLERVALAGQVIVFLDRNPDNLWCAVEHLEPEHIHLVTAHEVGVEEVEALLRCEHIDFYVLSLSGDLLAIATHEDQTIEGIRQVHCIDVDSHLSK